MGACASGPPKREGRIEGLPLERRGISAYFQNTLCDKTASFQCISLPCVVARNQLHFCAAAGASPGPLLLQCTVGSTSHRLTFARFSGHLELRSRPASPAALSFVQWRLPHKRSPPWHPGSMEAPNEFQRKHCFFWQVHVLYFITVARQIASCAPYAHVHDTPSLAVQPMYKKWIPNAILDLHMRRLTSVDTGPWRPPQGGQQLRLLACFNTAYTPAGRHKQPPTCPARPAGKPAVAEGQAVPAASRSITEPGEAPAGRGRSRAHAGRVRRLACLASQHGSGVLAGAQRSRSKPRDSARTAACRRHSSCPQQRSTGRR